MNSMKIFLCFILLTICKSNSRIDAKDKDDHSEDHDDIQSDVRPIYNNNDYSNPRSNCVGTQLVCKAKKTERIIEDTCIFT